MTRAQAPGDHQILLGLAERHAIDVGKVPVAKQLLGGLDEGVGVGGVGRCGGEPCATGLLGPRRLVEEFSNLLLTSDELVLVL